MHITSQIPYKTHRNFHTDDRAGPARAKPEAILSRIDYRRFVAEILG